MSIFVGLIDKDPIRLLTPILDKRSTCKKAIFIGSHEDKLMFQRLSSVLKKHSVLSEFYQIPSGPSVKGIKAEILDLANRLLTHNDDVYFNASCGLRHRLLSVYEVFRQFKWPIFVVEPFSDRLCWVYPEGKENSFIQDHISLEEYLSIFGAICERQTHCFGESHYLDLINVCRQWAKSASELGPGLATLNYLATTCRKQQVLSVELSDTQQSYTELNRLIDDLCQCNLAAYEGGILSFLGNRARRFANGEWLELLVNHHIEELSDTISTIQDKALNLQITRNVNSEEVKNEIDVAAIVNNKLHLIECKTKSMKSNGDDTLYKLESIKDLLGGFQARAMLISFRSLNSSDISRAKDLELALIGPKELPSLSEHLHIWLNGAGGYEPST